MNTLQVKKCGKSYESQVTCSLAFVPDWLPTWGQYLHFNRLKTVILKGGLQTSQTHSAKFRQSYLQCSNRSLTSLRLFVLLLIKLTCAEGGALLCFVLLRSPESPKPLNTAPIRSTQITCIILTVSQQWLATADKLSDGWDAIPSLGYPPVLNLPVPILTPGPGCSKSG